MSEEILINVTPRETRVGVVENGMLQEVHVERGIEARLCRQHLQGPGAAGDAGHAGGVRRDRPGACRVPACRRHRAACRGRRADVEAQSATGHVPSISELVHEGQEIVVQVVKDPISTKGARLSTHLSIPSRYLVLLPYARTLGVSARIEDEAERQRLT